ncbi:thiamine pyrophosphate-dependent enzyme [Gulosibacter sp. 10]|uniref:alpha-ketoacid dehydrogenase subunit alpha/beta n=1 Tax=Gulosibacter sp. 10 TaxID=1255570 RepID=UPI00097EF03B|nr:alpha-ketoacid dehydrogenase subunit alpha/beta [Gulosibacter sp. 10]SJM63884.1 Branched-chain alpha-keto acid dehydrogenase, E1 component, alpha subunit / Branched-chain alpha-keto acid dehydrogenase, E1 component, beta subunit [Gulosibacter sp. 10]
MPRRQRLDTGVDWIELTTTPEDWAEADPALLRTMLGQIQLIRSFEEALLELAGEGLVHGPAHSSIGQEGGAVGSILGLSSEDTVSGSHRGHHQFLAKAIGHIAPDGPDLEHLVPGELQAVLQRTLAEILGLAQGFSGGRGGSMHLQWLEAGALGTNAIVGGGAPMAAGSAWAHRRSGTDRVSINYFGDGSSQIGSVLESMNLAAVWKLPVAYFIENNLYAVSTHADEASADPRFSVRGQGFGIPSWRVDGMDPLAVYLATQEAEARMRSGEGPAVIEAEVYRFFHQNGPFPGSAFGYRAKQEEQAWRERDPLARVASELRRRELVDDEGIDSVRRQAEAAMAAAVAELVEQDPGDSERRRIRPDLWPDPKNVDAGIRSTGEELRDLRERDLEPAEDWRDVKFVDAVAEVMDRRMGEDERIIVMGEDVHHLGGGTNGATKGLAKRYGADRVIGTPISENAFFGLATGVATDGRFRPVVEFMYPDFMWVAADQVFNQAGKIRHMFGDNNAVPLVLRTKVAMGSGYGSQHLMDPAGIFATQAGWRIVAPSTAADYVGLMNAALALEDPVLVIEHVDLYGKKDRIPDGELDYVLPPGRAAVRRPGEEVTVISYLSMVAHAAEAIEQTGVDAELIDLRWLDRASLDWDTIGESIRKTNNVLIVEQGARGTSYGGWLADEIQRRYFDWLDQPVERVTGGEASPSISKVLERAAIAQTEEVVDGLERVRRAWGGQ